MRTACTSSSVPLMLDADGGRRRNGAGAADGMEVFEAGYFVGDVPDFVADNGQEVFVVDFLFLVGDLR